MSIPRIQQELGVKKRYEERLQISQPLFLQWAQVIRLLDILCHKIFSFYLNNLVR